MDNYTTIGNAIFFDKRISLRAKGLFVSICHQTQSEDALNLKKIQEACDDNEESAKEALEELKQAGYIVFEPEPCSACA